MCKPSPWQTNALTIDIGGGSTEFSYINQNNVSDTISLKLGTVRLKELYFDKNDIKGAIKYIDKQLENVCDKKIETLIGIGGTFRAIASAIMKNENYPLMKLHAYEFSYDKFSTYISSILDANDNQLEKLGIKKDRFDVIKPGTLILQRVIKKLKISKVVTSGVGVREGVFLSDLLRNSKHKFPHNFNTSIKYLVDSYIDDTSYSTQLNLLSKKIFDLTNEYFEIDAKFRYELALAAKLFPSGSSINFYSRNKQTYTLIQNSLEYGFTHKSITLIATLTKYAKNKLPVDSHLEKYADLLPKEKVTKMLSYILSLSIALLSHRPRNIDFDMQFENGSLNIISQSSLFISKDAVSKLECSDKGFKVIFNS